MYDAIYLIMASSLAAKIKQQPLYTEPSLAKEGFIHACAHHQLSYVIDRFFQTSEPLSVVTLDSQLLTAEIRYELASSAPELEPFPHIHGAVNTDAIIDICELAQFFQRA